jgi:Tfp pilus assembly protein PilX
MKPAKQRGAATLVVVMVLFFVISMVAAYTSRNMVFEQRTGANLYRASQSFEAAEAGMNWALMMLNSGRIDDQCRPSTDVANNSFRERHLNIDSGTGLITPDWLTPPVPPATTGTPLTPTCVFDGGTGAWSCSCPDISAPVLTTPTGTDVSPAFRVRFSAPALSGGGAVEPGLVRIDVVGCTRLDDDCLDVNGASLANEGRTVLGAVFMLSGRATAYPQAALTARGNVSASNLNVINAASGGSGITVHASGTINTAPPPTGLALTTSAGNALGGSTLDLDGGINPPAIAASGVVPGITAAERFFAATFMMTHQRWVQMPAVIPVNCPGGCSAATVRTAIANNPGRPLWLNGGLQVDSAGDIGSAAVPVMMVIDGNLEFTTAGVTVHGLLMLRGTGWNTALSTQPGTVRGAVIVDGDVTGSSSLIVQYDSGVLGNLRTSSGSFFRVAGSWRDWAMP